ncbi:MAG: helix-turn-helix domain-containing protein [Pseudomonas sp.]
MSDVFIEFAGRVLALTYEEFQQAAERGARLLPAKPDGAIGAAPDSEPLLTADQASELAQVPKQWLLAAAREGNVPHYRLGKYVRFRLSELANEGQRQPKQSLTLVK